MRIATYATTLIAAAGAAAGLLLTTALPASAAADAQPCVNAGFDRQPPAWNPAPAHWCPDWSPRSDGRIPVYFNPDHTSSVRGHLNRTGDRTNWYMCWFPGTELHLGGYYNDAWAYTMADNGQWGYVNQVYFQGGGNNEHDPGLPPCPS
ncbi:hypothetical protein LP52_20395 [Streptomonospora alba]|uniref:SH3b domain-containing protein n=1 Tax=Streptomonospora alba TaxID=183763 RepID=A0A0C2FDH7_9ACTN|nr:hypothetical protein [Streptomonospora alba]KIH97214.1 hypothetical protein LP52_20395 [Streptomonospora alba]